MAARIKQPPNSNDRNQLQSVDLSNQDAVREFFRKQWHRPKRKETPKTVKIIRINGKLVQVKTRTKLSDDENSKKICRLSFKTLNAELGNFREI